jgi:2-polyprenyl-3-methyl-5-hydroxy-6-metoxy-1,4-benzoquinol methylase
MEVLSPLTNKEALLIETINIDMLKNDYSENFDIDISPFLEGIDNIYIFKCQQTGYRFYYPFNIAGDSDFYKKLQSFDWYYMPWKWENQMSLKYFKKDDKILEVGSGGLGFIKKIKDFGFDIIGLELNEESIKKGKEIGVDILNQTVQDHANSNKEKYNVVCSYQVLEHISDVSSFIKAQVDCLKVGGKLIVCVPNNDSFIKLTSGGLLNKPPHHMGLWNKNSLSKISSIFGLKVDKVIFEPLQDYHVNWFVASTKSQIIFKSRYSRFLFNKLKMDKFYQKIISKFKNKIRGHSIMVVYTKL